MTNFSKTDDRNPSWSPDGSQLSYNCNIDGQVDVFTIPAKKGLPKHLLTKTGVNSFPQWLPDGKKLAFLHESTKEPRDIWICPFEGGQAKQDKL
jgi:Tol biopolymer transport system component